MLMTAVHGKLGKVLRIVPMLKSVIVRCIANMCGNSFAIIAIIINNNREYCSKRPSDGNLVPLLWSNWLMMDNSADYKQTLPFFLWCRNSRRTQCSLECALWVFCVLKLVVAPWDILLLVLPIGVTWCILPKAVSQSCVLVFRSERNFRSGTF